MRLTLSHGRVAGIVAAFASVIALALAAQAQAPPVPPSPSPSPVNMSQIPEHPEHPVVVELFASQGCGNCPKAVQVLAEMARRSDVIGLTYPVGIWDYLGWSDTFAKQEFAERQKAYNVALQNRGPYTPQMVFSGRYHSSGVNLGRIAEKFAQRNVTPLPARVSIGAGELAVAGTFDGPATVVLIRYMPGITHTTPGAGANRGKPMDYFNLVTSVQTLGPAVSGQTTKFRADCTKACAVLVQSKAATGWIIGAAQSR